jgi:histone H2A
LIFTDAAVYFTSVLEYLVAEVCSTAGNVAKISKRKRINPRHMMLAVRQDEEMNKLLKNVTFSEAGVLPHIQPVLISSKNQAPKK